MNPCIPYPALSKFDTDRGTPKNEETLSFILHVAVYDIADRHSLCRLVHGIGDVLPRLPRVCRSDWIGCRDDRFRRLWSADDFRNPLPKLNSGFFFPRARGIACVSPKPSVVYPRSLRQQLFFSNIFTSSPTENNAPGCLSRPNVTGYCGIPTPAIPSLPYRKL